jgi:hypothetical protein
VIGVVLAGPFLLAGDRANHSIARQAIQSPPGPATVKQGCDGVGMEEPSAARLSDTRSSSII